MTYYRLALACALIALTVSLTSLDLSTISDARAATGTWTVCSDYATWSDAYNAWVAAGKPARADADGDGIPCESLSGAPAAAPASPPSSTQPTPAPAPQGSCLSCKATVRLSLSRYPGTTRHVRDAIRKGKPRLLHIARDRAKANREASTSRYKTKKGFDRDEYPPAMSVEGGAGADVRLVKSKDNKGAGSSMGHQLHAYCNGAAFVIKFKP